MFIHQVFRTERRGWAVRTRRDIPRGGFITNYVGEIISYKEASARFAVMESRGTPNYILTLKEHVAVGGREKIYRTIVDASRYGNFSRFINHSCSPNVTIVPIRSHSMIPSLSMFSSRHIRSGEELFISYGSSDLTQIDPGKRKRQSERKICRCDSVDCEGFLPFEPF